MSFADRLKQVLADKNISQADLVVLTGIGKSSISQYISGKNVPSTERQKEIAIALRCPADYFDEPISDKRLTVQQTARLMGVSTKFVGLGLQQGVLPFGYAVKTSSQWSYFISAVKFTEHTGIEVS